METKVLVVDDEQGLREELVELFEIKGYKVLDSGLPSGAIKILEKEDIDIAVFDIKLPEMDGIELLKRAKELCPELEVIMISGHGDADLLLKALRAGAFDFFHKPLNADEIDESIKKTRAYIEKNRRLETLEAGNTLISKQLSQSVGDIIGTSPAMRKVIELTLKAAEAKDTSVLITGPSGSGKELIARVVHFAGARKDAVFYTANCSAIPESLIESELFGYRKGAFTGADSDRAGYFEATNGGTLFLDEIGDMPMNAQTKILRVLEERTVKRVGAHHEKEVDVRVVAATNQDIRHLIKENRFREDLYFRLNTIEIKIPPLKERKEDIPALLEKFVEVFAEKNSKSRPEIDESMYETLMEYDFPGNVRELRNMTERAVVLHDRGKLGIEHFLVPGMISSSGRISVSEGENSNLPTLDLDELEKRAIEEALKKTGGHQLKASSLLNISKSALNRKVQKHGIRL